MVLISPRTGLFGSCNFKGSFLLPERRTSKISLSGTPQFLGLENVNTLRSHTFNEVCGICHYTLYIVPFVMFSS